MLKKPLAGHEVSTLALLAQCSKIAPKEQQRIVSTLNGVAETIGRLILGEDVTANEDEKKAAEGFKSWANQIGSNNKERLKELKEKRDKIQRQIDRLERNDGK